MSKTCLRYAQDMPKISPRYAQCMPTICLRYAQYLPNICPRYAQYMPKICPRYAQDMPEICPRYNHQYDGPDKTSKPVLTKRPSRSRQNVHPDKTSADQILRHKMYVYLGTNRKKVLPMISNVISLHLWSEKRKKSEKWEWKKSESERKVRVKEKWEWNCSGWEPWDRDWRRSVNIDKISALNPNLLHLKQKTSASIIEKEEMYFKWYASK